MRMDNKSAFNIAVCAIGIAILVVHIIDLVFKKKKRTDEMNLLWFFVFTAVHFTGYLVFSIVRIYYHTDELIIASYTVLYIMNNMEMMLLFTYGINYCSLAKKTRQIAWITNIAFFSLFVILDIINIFHPLFFYAKGGVYMRTDYMIVSQGYQFIGFFIIFVIATFNKRLEIAEKIGFSIYCLLPLAAIILQNHFEGYALAYLSIVISIEVLFIFVNLKKNLHIAQEEQKLKEAEIKIMMSQIRPHFIYNSLASITTLIKIDPNKAEQSLETFTEYLRMNLSPMTDAKLIPFESELKHIKTYLELEKVRFDERLNYELDIKVTDFLVPPLSIQPLVENAVKHGILQRIEGGKVTIKAYEDDVAYYVAVDDNGVGFDVNSKDLDDPKHIGLKNVKYRVTTMTNGEMIINSVVGKGTSILVIFNK